MKNSCHQYSNVLQYNARWLDMSVEEMDKSFHLSSSSMRDMAQYGYSKPHKVYCLYRQGHLSISCRRDMLDKLNGIVSDLEKADNIHDLKACLTSLGIGKVNHDVKYYHSGSKPIVNPMAIKFKAEHYNKFLEFFMTENPGSETDWLQEYFDLMVSSGYAYGCFEAGKLVAAGEAPGIPFMQDMIVELGICTLEDYRNRGYAKAIIGNGIATILNDGKVPIWSCNYNNDASNTLAKSIGFLPFGEVLTIEEQ